MRAHEFLTERNYQQTDTLYHGTSDVFLRSILKQGLIVNPGQRNLVGGDDESLQLQQQEGVYFTTDRAYAKMAAEAGARKFGGRPIMIVINRTRNYGVAGREAETILLDIGLRAKQNNFQGYGNSDYLETALKSLPRGKYGRDIFQYLQEYYKILFNLLDTNPDLNPLTVKDYDEKEIRRRKLINTPELFNMLEKISASSRPDTTQQKSNPTTVNIRILDSVGYTGKTRIILIYDLFTNRVYYQAPDLGYKPDAKYFMYTHNSMDPRDAFNTIPKSHDPRRGIIAQNLYRR